MVLWWIWRNQKKVGKLAHVVWERLHVTPVSKREIIPAKIVFAIVEMILVVLDAFRILLAEHVTGENLESLGKLEHWWVRLTKSERRNLFLTYPIVSYANLTLPDYAIIGVVSVGGLYHR